MTVLTPRLIQYAQALEADSGAYYSRYLRDICRLMPDGGSFLDVGCGTGRVLREIYRLRPDAMFAGVEPVPYFRDLAKQSGVPVFDGTGHVLGKFDVVGSFTVIEHVEKPYEHIKECVDRVKSGGHFILAFPNMLCRSNKAMRLPPFMKREILKLYQQMIKAFGRGMVASEPKQTGDSFEPDDDALNITHELCFAPYIKSLGLKIISCHGTMTPSFLPDLLSRIPWARWAMPSVYLVARKV